LISTGPEDEGNDHTVALTFHQERDVGAPVTVEVADTAGLSFAKTSSESVDDGHSRQAKERPPR